MDIHDGYWSEPSDELDSDGKPVKRQRWIFTNPAHPSNQTGQGSPALSGEKPHNSSEVNNGKSESGNRRGRADHGGDFSANGNKRGERQAAPPTESQPVAERGAIRGGRDNVSNGEVSGEENRAVDIVGTGDGGGVGGGVDDAQPGKPGDDSRLAGGVAEPEVTGKNQQAKSALPVQAASLPVQATPKFAIVGKKAVPATNACTGIPDIEGEKGWRYNVGQPPLPKGFTVVPHLKSDISSIIVEAGQAKRITEIATGWQIQYGTKCAGCGKRYRPVCGFITPRAFRRMQKVGKDEQQSIVKKVIKSRFDAGRVGSRCADCANGSRGSLRSVAG